jgi:ABC-2 type transport system permease protein
MEVGTIAPMYWRAVREALRVSVATIVVPLVLPLFMLTIFAQLFSSITAIPGFGQSNAYVSYVAPAAILMGAMLGSPTTGISSAMELQTGFLSRIQMSSLSMSANLLVRRLADATRLAGFGLVLTGVAWLAGAEIQDWPLALVAAMVFAAVWGVAYGGLTLSVCLRTANIETAQALVPLFFPILFMSTALVPLEIMPNWLQDIARYNPVSYICDALRSAQVGHLDLTATEKAFVGIVVVAVFTQVLVWLAERKLARE